MVEVFKTNVQQPYHSRIVIRKLMEHFPNGRIDFDLEDCDKVLRIEADTVLPEKVIEVLGAHGYECLVME